MKKFLLFLTLFLSGVGIAQAAESSFTIKFAGEETTTITRDNFITTGVAPESQKYIGTCTSVASVSSSLDYLQIGSSTKYGAITFTLAENYQVYATKIVVNAKKINPKKLTTIKVNNLTSYTLTTEAKDFVYELDSSEKLTSITLANGDYGADYRFYVYSITVYYYADAGLAFTNPSEKTTYGEPYTLQTLKKNADVEVSWSSSKPEVADFVDGALIIKKAGTTVITATTDAEYANNTASYTLTIDKGDPTAFAYAEATYNYAMQTDGVGFSPPALNIPEGLTVASYRSSKPAVAKVAQDGTITPLDYGKTTITAYTYGNDCWNEKSATLTINITRYNPTLSFTNTEVSLFVEEAAAYEGQTLTFTPADLTVTYALNKEATIGTIDPATGKLTLNGTVGTATVTATSTETGFYQSKSASYTIEVKKHTTQLTFDQAAVKVNQDEAYTGQVATCTIEEALKEDFTITYASDNEAVATVDANTGAVTLTGTAGIATITATASGNTYYTSATASYTITVAKQYFFADTKVTLVTDASTLKPGDIIAIGHWSDTQSQAMSNSTTADYFIGEDATYNSDHSELTLTKTVLLMELEEVTVNETTQWGLKTINFDGEQGYIGGSENKLSVSNTADEEHTATITIADGVTKILFTGSFELRCNTDTNPKHFAAYAGTVQEVYIYKVETPQTIVGEDLTEVTMNEGYGPNTLSAMSKFNTNSTATEFVVKMNDVAITSADLAKENNEITVNLSGLPYLPGAVFTIAPVVNGVEGHSEVLGIQVPALPTFNVTVSEASLTYNSKETEEGYCNIDVLVKLYITSTAGEGAKPFNYYFDIENKSGFENHAWDWLNDDKGYGITYIVKDYLTNVTTQKHGEGENTFWTPVLPTEASLYATLEFDVKPYFAFYVTPELASLITEATPAPMAAPARAGEAFVLQNVYSTQVLEQQFNFSATTEVSGVEGVTVDGGAAVEYFNLQGVRIDGDLAPGIYIRRQGQSVSKVQIR